jgi:FixJ family two-component response regulator
MKAGPMSTTPLVSIVDDDESVRQGTESLMRAVGYVAETFVSAADFLNSDAPRRTSCLIVDMQMPGMTGLELYGRLVASGTPIPTILITAYPDARVEARALKAGIRCYLSKPFTEDELLGCIRASLGEGGSDG